MLHDPEVYPDPLAFVPERHIATPDQPAQRDPRTACFGYGRRICPGLSLAEASIFCAITMSLATFDITKTLVNGVEITPVHENTSGLIRYVGLGLSFSHSKKLNAPSSFSVTQGNTNVQSNRGLQKL